MLTLDFPQVSDLRPTARHGRRPPVRGTRRVSVRSAKTLEKHPDSVENGDLAPPETLRSASPMGSFGTPGPSRPGLDIRHVDRIDHRNPRTLETLRER